MNDFNSFEHESNKLLLSDLVLEAVQKYFSDLGEDVNIDSINLYKLVLHEVEKPLLEAVMNHTKNNQFKSAKILGLSRGTFRSKLKIYGML